MLIGSISGEPTSPFKEIYRLLLCSVGAKGGVGWQIVGCLPIYSLATGKRLMRKAACLAVVLTPSDK